MDEHEVAKVMRHTYECIRASTDLKARAKESIVVSQGIVFRSRELVHGWTVNGFPSFPRLEDRRTPLPVLAAVKVPVEQRPAARREAEACLERVSERDFAGEVVRLDGRHFTECNLKNCTLEYSGGPVLLEGTHFSGCRFRFGGEAAMTVSMLECFNLIEERPERTACSLPNSPGTPRVN